MPRIRRTKSANQIQQQVYRLVDENGRRVLSGESDNDRFSRILDIRDRYIRNISRVPRVNRLVNIANNPRTDYDTASRANARSMNIQVPRDTYMGIARGAVAK